MSKQDTYRYLVHYHYIICVRSFFLCSSFSFSLNVFTSFLSFKYKTFGICNEHCTLLIVISERKQTTYIYSLSYLTIVDYAAAATAAALIELELVYGCCAYVSTLLFFFNFCMECSSIRQKVAV